MTATGLAVVLDEPWLIAAVGCASLAWLVGSSRGKWTPSGTFGVANAVTVFRLGLSSSLVLWPPQTPGLILAAVALSVFALDGIDGWLARRFACSSEFGAEFDMETDALFFSIAAVALVDRFRFGFWVLIIGSLRYVYVLVTALIPPRGTNLKRARWGRYAFSFATVGLIAAFAWPSGFGRALAGLGTVGLMASFAWSFWLAYQKPALTRV